MAKIAGIYVADGGASASTADLTGTISGTTSTSEIVLGPNRIFAFNANGDVNIRFGVSGMPAASAADFRIPSGSIAEYEMGTAAGNDRIRLYNPGASSITYWIQPLHA